MPFTEGLCPSIQKSLNTLIGQNSPHFTRTATGYLDALISPLNLRGLVSQNIITPGKTMQVTYLPPTGSTIVTTEAACYGDGAEVAPLDTTVSLDNYRKVTRTYEIAQMRKLCESNYSFLTTAIYDMMNELRVEINQRAIALGLAAAGVFQDGSTTKVMDLVTAGGAPQYFELAKGIQEYRKIAFSGTPILVGFGDLDLYTSMAGIGCCNDSGINIASTASMYNYFADVYLDTVIGANENYWMIAPGTSLFLYGNKFSGENRYKFGETEKSTIVDPTDGLEYDFVVIFDPACGKYSISLDMNFTLLPIPSDAWGAGHINAGVNGTLRFTRT